MEQCIIKISKNGQCYLKGLKNNNEFKSEDEVILLSKSEYESLLSSNTESEDYVNLHKNYVNVDEHMEIVNKANDLESQILLNQKDIEYKDIKIDELQKQIETLKSEATAFERDKEEMKQTHNQNIVLQNDLKHIEMKLEDTISDKEKYIKLCNVLINRGLWDRIKNNIPFDDY